MPSIRSKLITWYLQSTMKQLPLAEMGPAKVRAVLDKKPLLGLPKGIDLTVINEPIKGEWQRPADSSSNHTILYFHGGGYVFGRPHTHRLLTYQLALAAQANLFSLDYRLAPEHPCPAAIDDAVAAYQWLRARGHDPKNISFAGDSAGGGLVMSALQTLRDNGDPMPSSAILYSPYTDLALEGASHKGNAETDAMFKLSSIELGAKYYAGELGARDPRCSPLYGNMSGLPPLLIYASSSEMLLDDSARLVRRAEQEGVDVSFVVHEGLPHAWPIFGSLIPEAMTSIKESAVFVRKYAPFNSVKD